MQQEDTKPIDGISLMEYQEPYVEERVKGEGRGRSWHTLFGVTREVRDGPSTDYILHKRKPTCILWNIQIEHMCHGFPLKGTIHGGFAKYLPVAYLTRSNVPLAIGFIYLY